MVLPPLTVDVALRGFFGHDKMSGQDRGGGRGSMSATRERDVPEVRIG